MMNITGKYLKVWEVEEKDGRIKLNLGDSKKNQDGTYTNWTWFGAMLVGNAKQVTVKQGDTVEVKSGIITMNKATNGKYYTNITIFEIEVMSHAETTQAKPAGQEFEDDVPF